MANSFREVLRLPGVRRLWAAQIVSIFGDFLAIFAVFGYVTFKLGGTATEVASILIAYMLPLGLIGPIAGAFVDRWDARRTMIASDLIRAVLAICLIFATNLYQIYAIFLALSTVSSFFVPAQSIMVRALVPKEGLMSANALMSQAVQVMQIVSPAVAGTMVSLLGAHSCYWVDGFSFLFSAAMVFGIVAKHPKAAGPSTARAIAGSVVEGMKFILTHAAVSFVILAMTAGMFAIRCFGALMAVYVRDVLHSTPAMFGAVSSLIGLGMIGGTQVINRFAKNAPKPYVVVGGLVGAGMSILLVAALSSVIGTVAGMLALGVSVAFIMIPAQTLLQQETPATMMGRVSSSLWSVLAFAQILAMLIAGPGAQAIGIRNWYFTTGVVMLVFAGVGMLRAQRPPAPSAAAA